MIRPDQIPPEVVEAAYVAFTTKLHDNWRDELRASIAAALAAWPGAYHAKGYNTYFEGDFDHVVIPLPQEPEA